MSKISQMAAAGTLTGNELFEVVQDGTNKKATLGGTYVAATVAMGTGIDPTGVADSTAALQAKLNGGGVVVLPPGTYRADGLAPPAGTTLTTLAGARANAKAIIKARDGATSAFVIDATAADVAVIGVNIDGHGIIGGIRFTGGGCAIKNCFIQACAKAAIDIAGIASTLEDIYAYNVNATAPTALTGGVIVRGSDHSINRVEIAGSPGFPGSLASTNLYRTAFYVPGTNNMFTACVGELGDVGFWIAGDKNKFSSSRADLNHGHGWFVGGYDNVFGACGANDNSSGQDGLYDGWHLTGQGNCLSACNVTSAGTYGLMRYGIFDSAQGAGVAQHNHYAANSVSGFKTRMYSFLTAAAAGPTHSPVYVESTSATPNVEGATLVGLYPGAATTVTAFLGGTPGQRLYVQGNANVTIQHNAAADGFYTRTGANRVLEANKVYRFTKFGSSWYEDAD